MLNFLCLGTWWYDVIPDVVLVLRFVIFWVDLPVRGSVTVWIKCCTGSPVMGSGIIMICCDWFPPTEDAPLTNSLTNKERKKGLIF